MNSITTFKLTNQENENERYDITFDVVPNNQTDSKLKQEIESAISNLDVKIDDCKSKIEEINKQIDFFTNDADKIDIIVSAASGIITAALDAVLKEIRLSKTFGGNFEGKDLLDFLNIDGADTVNKAVDKIANSDKTKDAIKKAVTSGNSTVKTDKISDESLKGLISFLEKRFNIPSDSLTSKFGGSKQHHLRDFSHHPSIAGLIFSLLTQFTMKCYGTDTSGKFITEKLEFISGKEGRIAKSGKEIKVIGENTGEKILFGTVFWFFHLVSDVAGSSNTPGAGMGIPGPLMSLAKELSALPIFRAKNEDGNKVFSVWLSKLYNGTLFAKRDENGKLIPRKVDFRTEVGAFKELGKQAIPVLLNEFIVRGFYFVRRFAAEIKEKNIHSFSDLNKINAEKVFPFKNRTVLRMLTVSTGAFTATNLAAAAAVSGVKSGGNPAAFVSGFVMRINFVGVGRFAVAIASDISGGIKKSKAEKEKFVAEIQMIKLTNAKVYYLNAASYEALNELKKSLIDVFDTEKRMWISSSDSKEAIFEMEKYALMAGEYYSKSFSEIKSNLIKINGYISGVEKNNPDLLTNLFDDSPKIKY